MANAFSRCRLSLTMSPPASYGWKNHLWASMLTESARSIPSRSSRPSRVTRAKPPYAASACSQTPSRSQRSAIACRGSMEPVLARSRVGAHGQGPQPGVTIARQQTRQRVQVDSEVVPGGHQTDVFSANAGDQGCPPQ